MKWMKTLCAMLAMLLALGGCLAGAEEELFSQGVDQPVEELELALGEGLTSVAGDAGVLAVETAEETAAPEDA